jgi:hypothetical protein
MVCYVGTSVSEDSVASFFRLKWYFIVPIQITCFAYVLSKRRAIIEKAQTVRKLLLAALRVAMHPDVFTVHTLDIFSAG